MKKILILSILTFLLSSHASHKSHKHHSEKAHVHGSGEVSLVFEGTKGKLQFESPGDSTLGFEHKPKTDVQKKHLEETLALIKTKISEMIIFQADLKCNFVPLIVQFKQERGSHHGETHGEFDIFCAKSPRGTTLKFDFIKFFPKLEKLNFEVIVDDLQKSALISAESSKLELK